MPPAPPADAWSGTTRSSATATRARPARSDTAGRADPVGAAPTAERGLPASGALVLLVAIAGVGGLIDTISGAQVRGGFNIGIIIAAVLAILAVRRSAMFPIVIAPPLVYAGASGAMLYFRSGGLHDRQVLFDGAANWLVYGFPAIAAATAAVLVIAGIRLVSGR